MHSLNRLFFALLAIPLAAAHAVDASFPGLTTPVLETRFTEEPLGPIGMEGAELGQPIDLLNGLTAEIVDDGSGGRTLELERNEGTGEQLAVFEFLGQQGFTSGLVYIDFELSLPRRDNYVVRFTRQGFLTGSFQTLRLASSGNISIWAGGDDITTTIGNYSAGSTLSFSFIYDMDARTYDVFLNDIEVASDRPFNVLASFNLGRVSVGYQSTATGGGFELGRLRVGRDVELQPVLMADFADKPLNQPIGTGGAEIGEPFTIVSALTTEVVEIEPGNRGLHVERASGTAVADVRWKFLNEIGLDDGHVLADVFIAAEHFSDYRLTFRGGTTAFYQIVFDSDGEIRRAFPGSLLLGTYEPGQMIRVRIHCDMQERHCSSALDDVLVDSKRAMAYDTPAIDNLITGKMGSSAVGTAFTLEQVAVYSSQSFTAPADRYFVQQPTATEYNTQIVPAVSVRVNDELGEPVADPVSVTLQIEGGTPGAELANATATTVDGVASFPNLSIDRPGTAYHLRAQVADLPDTTQSLSEPFDILGEIPDSIFADRWQSP